MRALRRTWAAATDPRIRRAAYAALLLVFGVLILFPQPFVSRAKIVPQDTSASAASTTTLLGALGGGSQSIGSLLTGGRPSNDLYLIIGRSDSVMEEVIAKLGLVGPDRRFATLREAKLDIAKKVDVHLLLGGAMEIETKMYDRDAAQRLTVAYANAISRQLALFGRQIITNKQRIVNRRFQDATERVARAEARLNAFRRANNLAEPEQQLGAALAQRTGLEADLAAKQIELRTLQQSRGPEAVELAAIRSDIAGLREQIVRSTTPRTGIAGPNLTGLTLISTRYLAIYRDFRFQQSIYDVYQRSAEQVAVEELAAESASYIQVIDPAHIDAERHFNVWAIAAFAAVLLAAIFTEWYAPATGLFRHRRADAAPGILEPA